jgi:hypothetical protein
MQSRIGNNCRTWEWLMISMEPSDQPTNKLIHRMDYAHRPEQSL